MSWRIELHTCKVALPNRLVGSNLTALRIEVPLTKAPTLECVSYLLGRDIFAIHNYNCRPMMQPLGSVARLHNDGDP